MTTTAIDPVEEKGGAPENETMIGTTAGGVAIEIIEAGEMTPAIGLEDGQTILLT